MSSVLLLPPSLPPPQCGNMAREGLRTLVVGKKVLSEEQYSNFESRYRQAKLSVSDRETQVLRQQFNLLY